MRARWDSNPQTLGFEGRFTFMPDDWCNIAELRLSYAREMGRFDAVNASCRCSIPRRRNGPTCAHKNRSEPNIDAREGASRSRPRQYTSPIAPHFVREVKSRVMRGVLV